MAARPRSRRPPANPADLVIVNGRCTRPTTPAPSRRPWPCSGNTILKVGTTDEIRALAGPDTRVIDAHGATVAPGFNDSHVHFISGGLSLGDVDLAGLTTLRQVQDTIRDFAARKPRRAWVRAAAGSTRRSPAAAPRGAARSRWCPTAPR